MDEEQSSSELRYGSEARPNTPFADPFAGLDTRKDLLEDNTGCTSTTKDPDLQLWMPEDNTTLRNHSDPSKPHLSYKYSLTKRKTLPNLTPLTEEPNLTSNERKLNENEIIKQESGSNGQKIDSKSKRFKKVKVSSKKTKESDHNSLAITNYSKSEVTLPKIDTYCISYVRPSTNHGFAYAVSSTELLNGKNTTSRRAKHQKTKYKSKESTPENGLPRQGSMYLLFRAPSRAYGLNNPGLKVRARPKELHHLKGAKQIKKANATVQTNIVRLPDINEDMWK